MPESTRLLDDKDLDAQTFVLTNRLLYRVGGGAAPGTRLVDPETPHSPLVFSEERFLIANASLMEDLHDGAASSPMPIGPWLRIQLADIFLDLAGSRSKSRLCAHWHSYGITDYIRQHLVPYLTE